MSPPDPFLRPSLADADLQVRVPATKPAPRLPTADRATGVASFCVVGTSFSVPLPAPSGSAAANLSVGVDAFPPESGIVQLGQGHPLGRARVGKIARLMVGKPLPLEWMRRIRTPTTDPRRVRPWTPNHPSRVVGVVIVFRILRRFARCLAFEPNNGIRGASTANTANQRIAKMARLSKRQQDLLVG